MVENHATPPMAEEWRPIPEWEGLYEVSNLGRVRSLDREVPHKTSGKIRVKGRVLRPATHKVSGHPYVILSFEGESLTMPIHQAVAAAFIGPRPEGMEVCHYDDVPVNNHVRNLRYGTRSGNKVDSVRNGGHNNASKTHCKRGHEFTPENTAPNTGGRGRQCRTCNRDRKKEWARKNREKRHPIKINR